MRICKKCLVVEQYDYMIRHDDKCYDKEGLVASKTIEFSTYLRKREEAIEEIRVILHKRMMD